MFRCNPFVGLINLVHRLIISYCSQRAFMKYRLPLREIVIDFYNELKSITSGYATFDYEDDEWVQLAFSITLLRCSALAFRTLSTNLECGSSFTMIIFLVCASCSTIENWLWVLVPELLDLIKLNMLFWHFITVPHRYQKSDMVKLDILLNGQPVDAMATIVHNLKAQRVGRELVEKLKKFIDRFTTFFWLYRRQALIFSC